MFEHLDPALPTPLYAQLAERLRAAIALGELAPGELLPSVRQLAGQLRLNPGTIAQAYRELERAGLLELRQGAGTFVRELPPGRRTAEQSAVAARLAGEMLARAGSLGLSGDDLLVALKNALGRRTDD
jgi:GntR family transcriptional regulator